MILTFIHQTLSWLPVDSAACVVAEILLNPLPLRRIYHLENPVRQDWQEVVRLMSSELRIPSPSIIPLEDWLDLVASVTGSGNPASSLVQFLRNDFAKMSCGSLILDTFVSRNASVTLSNMTSVEERTIKGYTSYWRRVKHIK